MLAVFEHSKSTKGARLVLLAIAENSHDDGTGAHPAVATIAAKARLSERATQDAIKKLQELEPPELAVEYNGGPAGANRYTVLLPGLATPAETAPLEQPAPRRKPRQRGAKPAPEPTTEPTTKNSGDVAPPSPKANEIMQRVLVAGVNYHPRITGHLAREIKVALDAGFPPARVTLAARRALEKGSPGLLPNMLTQGAPVATGPVPENQALQRTIESWREQGCQFGASDWCDRRGSTCDRCNADLRRLEAMSA